MKPYFPKMHKPLTFIYLHPKFIEKYTKKVKQAVLNIQVYFMIWALNKFTSYFRK